MISLIAAISTNYVIGKDNCLPWHLPNDLIRFKEVTMGKIVVMGRKTWESIGKPLPGRLNIVLTKDEKFEAEGAKVSHDIASILSLSTSIKDEIFIIGGAQIYEKFLPYADFIYLTVVHTQVEGDAFFPRLDPFQWEVMSSEVHPADKANPYKHVFYKLRRVL